MGFKSFLSCVSPASYPGVTSCFKAGENVLSVADCDRTNCLCGVFVYLFCLCFIFRRVLPHISTTLEIKTGLLCLNQEKVFKCTICSIIKEIEKSLLSPAGRILTLLLWSNS